MITVSVCMITYNHENYIKDAIEGVLMQRTDFSIELVIGEDCSKDRTLKICADYASRYPSIIKLLPSEKNLGVMPNLYRTINACTGKYIAYCEGDDYWIDPIKLQKQVDFLELNQNFSATFHDAIIIWEDKSQQPRLFCDLEQEKISTIEDIINKSWFIPSASILFRTDYIKPLPQWFKQIYNGDYSLLLMLASKGEIGFINKPMSIYRKNEGSLSGGIGKNLIYINIKLIELLSIFNIHTHNQFELEIKDRVIKLKQEIEHLQRRQRNIFYKYMNLNIWIQKIINILNSKIRK